MNAGLANTLPVKPQGADHAARGRKDMPGEATSFRDTLASEKQQAAPQQNAGEKPNAENAADPWKPVGWSLPHDFEKKSIAAARSADSRPKQDEDKAEAVDALPTAPKAEETDLPQSAQDGDAADETPDRLPEQASETARNAADNAEPPTTVPAPQASESGTEHSKAGEHIGSTEDPAPRANDRARERAAPVSALNREQQHTAEKSAEPAAPRAARETEKPAEASKTVDPLARPGNEAKPATDGAPQPDIRVVSIQRAPAPATAADPAVQKSAAPEAIQLQQPHQPEAGRVLHTLKIELHPAELGPVTARLRVVADQLSVDLQVENAEARHRLGNDSDAIVKALRSLGYDIDRVTVQQSAASSQNNMAGNHTGRDSAFQSTSEGQGDSQSRGTGGERSQDERGGQAKGTREHAETSGSGLYI
ncbi:flagellar hook-length control protein FliK [Nitratireductor indicus]|uniref:flagellar hook-length control protein FliK n=1 Tax=Nitratireductor indicus TaxID=721133 RepID=UPI0028741097|nr:flagellar hook-length control protein FliK [Nitratireductor indicus]MDS1136107.1 flagellar hook-length control protein FliK [Nitratireductor indicus]